MIMNSIKINCHSYLCFQCVILLLPTSYCIVKTNTRYLQMLLVSPYRFTSKNAEWLEIKVIILIIDICLAIIMKSGRAWVLSQASQHYSQQHPEYTMYTAVNLSYLVCYDHIFVCVLYAAANRRQILMHDESAPWVCSVHCSWSRWYYHNIILLTHALHMASSDRSAH